LIQSSGFLNLGWLIGLLYLLTHGDLILIF